MKNSLELIDERNQIESQLEKLIETGKKEERKLNDVENTEFETLTEKIKEIDIEIENINIENKRALNGENKKINNKMEEIKLINLLRNYDKQDNLNETEKRFLAEGRAQGAKIGAAGSIQLPYEYRDAVQAGAVGHGAETVATSTWNLLTPLYANLVLTQAGASVVSSNANINLPIYSGAKAYWESELATVPDGTGNFTKISLTPHRLSAQIIVSKQWLNMDTISAEASVRADLIDAMHQEIESTLCSRLSGDTTMPTPFFSGVNVTYASGITYQNVIDLETNVELLNPKNSLTAILSPRAKNILRGTKKNEFSFIYENDKLDGINSLTSTNVLNRGFIIGDFSNLKIVNFGPIDLVIDPYTAAGEAALKITVNMWVDAKFVRPTYVTAIV